MSGNKDSLNRLQVAVNKTIASGATYLTDPIDIADLQLVGNVTLQIEVTGSGTLTTEYLLSNSYSKINPTADFVKATGNYQITNLSTFTATSGVGSDGKEHADIPMNNAQAFKMSFKATTNSIVLNAWLSLQ